MTASHVKTGWVRIAVSLLLLLLVSGCAGLRASVHDSGDRAVYVVADSAEASLALRHAPAFLVEGQENRCNRIGTPSVVKDAAGREQVAVDPATPTMYVQQQNFHTDTASYTNLIYRVHFERVPFSLVPLHLTAGRNGGIIVIVTLNDRREPVLVTTVHTCGCYLAITPTSYLPASAYPEGWQSGDQMVYGVKRPGLIPMEPGGDWRLILDVLVRYGDRRVAGMRAAPADWGGTLVRQMALRPMADLEHLHPEGPRVSFFEEQGRRKGYVKNSQKPLEMLLMGWWCLDLRVGEDKALGPIDETGVVFYTSLKPWARRQSDLWRFAECLRYWGWKL